MSHLLARGLSQRNYRGEQVANMLTIVMIRFRAGQLRGFLGGACCLCNQVQPQGSRVDPRRHRDPST